MYRQVIRCLQESSKECGEWDKRGEERRPLKIKEQMGVGTGVGLFTHQRSEGGQNWKRLNGKAEASRGKGKGKGKSSLARKLATRRTQHLWFVVPLRVA
jgi:hypothetical protein